MRRIKKHNDFKIHILFKFIEGPYGGGNQFLKALRDYFNEIGIYSEKPEEADIILFNSHHCLSEVFRLKKRYSDKILIHRIDGPVFLYTKKIKITDKIIYDFNKLFADANIFQSKWSRKKNYEEGMKKSNREAIIMNAPNPHLFNNKNKSRFNAKKIKIIATAWAPIESKGFDIYQYLDENLDFSKYEMIFVGESPIKFKNIKWIKPVPSKKLAEILKQQDIYLTASKNDPCSNSLIEALSCGLPAIVRNDGGHPELVKKGGVLFEGEKDIFAKIEKVSQNYIYYTSKIPKYSINEVGESYYAFIKKIYNDKKDKKYSPKQITFFRECNFYKIKIMILIRTALSKIERLIKK